MPIEVWELLKGVTWPRVTLLVVNLAIVLYLARTLPAPDAEVTRRTEMRN